MANIKISELDELQEVADQDLFVIVDSDENTTKKIQAGNLNIKGGDTLPIGAMVEYNGTTVPQGYEKVEDKVVTLYENTAGTTGNVSLSKSIANYDYLDIMYGDSTRKMVQRIATNSTTFNLSRQIVDNSKNVFYRNTQYTLSSNSISVQYFNAYTIYSANNNIVFETLTSSGVTIYKVIGYKEV